MQGTGALAHCNALSLSLHQYAPFSSCVVVFWSCMRCHSAQELKRLPMARRAPLHPLMKCVPHPLSVVSVPLADGGAMPHMSVHWELWRLSSSFQCSCPRTSSLPGCHHLAKASDCRDRRGDPGGQQQRTWAAVLSLRPHVEVWSVERHYAQWSGSRTWASSHRSGRGEVEALQFDRGGSDAMLREQRVRDQNVCSLCAIIPCLPLLQRTRPGVLPHRPRAPREAARVHRVRVDCRASSSTE